MVSADNAHAFHPAHAEKYDPKSRVYMNGGVVIKQSANQKYTTDAVSEAVTKMICEGRRTVPGIRKPRRHSGRKHARRNSELSCLGDKRGYRNGSACDAFPV